MLIPPKLKPGDEVRIIAPSDSFLPNITLEMRKNAILQLEELGLKVSFGKHVYVHDMFSSARVEKRLEDIHDAFADPKVKAVIPVSGGTTANELIQHLDYNLIKKNPKIFCGLSDHTNIQAAIHKKTGLITYYGPHYAALGSSTKDDYTMGYFHRCLFSSEPFNIHPSNHFHISAWETKEIENSGFWPVSGGKAKGKLLGGNLLTLNLLQGSNFFPDLENAILFVEDNSKITKEGFFNQLQALMNLPGFKRIKGLLIGRFQPGSEMDRKILTEALRMKDLKVPVAGNIDFGHTLPMATLPIGGDFEIDISDKDVILLAGRH